MKASELRIGNFVNVPNIKQSPFRVDYFDDQKVYQKSFTYTLPSFASDIPFHPLTWDLEDVSGIPLTPEILEMAGFEKTYESSFSIRYDHNLTQFIGYDISKADSMETGLRYYGNRIKVQYLHQLQNLYFALTGQELNIDLNH
jgi:hypothetical protein